MEAFERIARQVPKWRDFDIGQLIAATVKQPLDDLEAAAKAGNGRASTRHIASSPTPAMPATRAPMSA